jgi:hypothetical protein
MDYAPAPVPPPVMAYVAPPPPPVYYYAPPAIFAPMIRPRRSVIVVRNGYAYRVYVP